MRFCPMMIVLGIVSAMSIRAEAAFTLDQLFAKAQEQSESLSISRLEIEGLEQSGVLIETRNRPRISLSGEFDRAYTKLGSQDLKGDWQPSVRTEIRQPLYEGGRNAAQQKSLEQSKAAARWDMEARREYLYSQVSELFYQILSGEQDMANLRESERIYQDRIKTLESRARIGKSRNAEVLAAKTQLDAISAQIKASASMQGIAQRNLSSLTGQQGPLALSDRVNLSAASLPPETSKTIATVEAAKARIALAESRIEEQRIGNKPKVDFIAEHSWSYPFPDGTQANKLSFGVGLTWILYDGGEVQAQIANAVIEKSKASVTESLQKRDNTLAREQAVRALSDGMEQIRLYDKALAAAEKNVRVQQQEFENGMLTNLDVMQALDIRLQIKRSRDQALYRAKLAFVDAQLQLAGIPKLEKP